MRIKFNLANLKIQLFDQQNRLLIPKQKQTDRKKIGDNFNEYLLMSCSVNVIYHWNYICLTVQHLNLSSCQDPILTSKENYNNRCKSEICHNGFNTFIRRRQLHMSSVKLKYCTIKQNRFDLNFKSLKAWYLYFMNIFKRRESSAFCEIVGNIAWNLLDCRLLPARRFVPCVVLC